MLRRAVLLGFRQEEFSRGAAQRGAEGIKVLRAWVCLSALYLGYRPRGDACNRGKPLLRQPAGAGPDACPFTVTYEATVEGNVVRSIFYQTFEHGIPRREARGTAPKGRALTVSAVESYSKELIERLAAETAPKDKKEPAAFMKRPNWAE